MTIPVVCSKFAASDCSIIVLDHLSCENEIDVYDYNGKKKSK